MTFYFGGKKWKRIRNQYFFEQYIQLLVTGEDWCECCWRGETPNVMSCCAGYPKYFGSYFLDCTSFITHSRGTLTFCVQKCLLFLRAASFLVIEARFVNSLPFSDLSSRHRSAQAFSKLQFNERASKCDKQQLQGFSSPKNPIYGLLDKRVLVRYGGRSESEQVITG